MQTVPKLKIINKKGKDHVFDLIRKKYVVLTPEEEVRQVFLHFLINEKGYPPGLIAVESSHTYLDQKLRTDILVFGRDGQPKLIVECKAPSIVLNQKVLNQVAKYNIGFKVDYLIITNGESHFVCVIDHSMKTYEFMEQIPAYDLL